VTILLVAPLHKELGFLTQSLRERGYQAAQVSIGRIAARHFSALDVTVAHGGHGKTQLGVQTQHLLDHAGELEGVICVGAAGALADDLAVGDLVLATTTVEHDYTERFSLHPLPRFDANAQLLDSLYQPRLRPLPFAVHAGIVASGDEDVIELERAAALRQATEACAVAWEGAGGARACRFSGVAYLELRGITDTADHTAPADFAANLQIAMSNAATLIALWRGA
jgi:adenosylhomocysteine nucleosidase